MRIDGDAKAAIYAQAADILAEMLGYTVAAVDAGREFTPLQTQSARDAIIIWHQMRHKAESECDVAS